LAAAAAGFLAAGAGFLVPFLATFADLAVFLILLNSSAINRLRYYLFIYLFKKENF
jgi:hypothetical protein